MLVVIYNFICVIGTFSGHEGNTSKTMMTSKVIIMLCKLLALIGRQFGHLQSNILRTPLRSSIEVNTNEIGLCVKTAIRVKVKS